MSVLLWADATALGVFGLLVGSFLNVVIYRLPKILEQQWAQDLEEFSQTTLQENHKNSALATPEKRAVFNLMAPRSRCQVCSRPITWYENVPLLSYAALRGRCAGCQAPISIRYPAVEASTAVMFAFCGYRWGITPTAFAWSGFTAALLALALIDWDTTLLPDDITLPLLWSGLIASNVQWTTVTLQASLWGCVAGYLSLWLIYWVFKLITGKEGMGYGDFKLFAAMGAWFGWTALVPMILMASVIGAVVGIALKFSSGLRQGGYIPFGPFLALAGLTSLVVGPQAILKVVGL